MQREKGHEYNIERTSCSKYTTLMFHALSDWSIILTIVSLNPISTEPGSLVLSVSCNKEWWRTGQGTVADGSLMLELVVLWIEHWDISPCR